MIREAARSGLSVREFCRRHNLKEGQFHWWHRTLKNRRQARALGRQKRSRDAEGQATFALVSDGPEDLDAGIELVLGDGRRLRIGKGVDEQTLRTVLAAVGPEGC
jgi:transposase-like protein